MLHQPTNGFVQKRVSKLKSERAAARVEKRNENNENINHNDNSRLLIPPERLVPAVTVYVFKYQG